MQVEYLIKLTNYWFIHDTRDIHVLQKTFLEFFRGVHSDKLRHSDNPAKANGPALVLKHLKC
jgi:hypothetical protein